MITVTLEVICCCLMKYEYEFNFCYLTVHFSLGIVAEPMPLSNKKVNATQHEFHNDLISIFNILRSNLSNFSPLIMYNKVHGYYAELSPEIKIDCAVEFALVISTVHT